VKVLVVTRACWLALGIEAFGISGHLQYIIHNLMSMFTDFGGVLLMPGFVADVLVAKTVRKNYNKALRRVAEGRAPPHWIRTRQAVTYRATVAVRADSHYLLELRERYI
jgi:hypothetical protein